MDADFSIITIAFLFVQVPYSRGQCNGTPQALTVNLLQTFTLTTPGFPNGYAPSQTCVWTVDVSASNHVLLLQAVDIDVDCAGDGITVEDGITGIKHLSNHCQSGAATTVIFAIDSGKVTITFTSDATTKATEKGLKILMYRLPKSSEVSCAALTTLQANENKETLLLSPNFPFTYPNDASCQWDIDVTSGQSLTLTLYFEDVEKDNSCTYDYIQINTSSTVLVKSCNEWTFSQTTEAIFKANGTVSVIFKSDDSTQKRGFMIGYSAEVQSDSMSTTTTEELTTTSETPTTTEATTTTTTSTTTTEAITTLTTTEATATTEATTETTMTSETASTSNVSSDSKTIDANITISSSIKNPETSSNQPSVIVIVTVVVLIVVVLIFIVIAVILKKLKQNYYIHPKLVNGERILECAPKLQKL